MPSRLLETPLVSRKALKERELSARLSVDADRQGERLATSQKTVASLRAELAKCKADAASRASALVAARDDAVASTEREASAREAGLRSELDAIRSTSDDAKRDLEGEFDVVRGELRAAVESVGRMKSALEAAEAAEASAAAAAQTASKLANEQRGEDTAALESLKAALRAAEERACAASETAARATEAREAKEAWAVEALGAAKAAADEAAKRASAREAEARAQALSEALEADRGVRKVALVRLQMLRVGLGSLLACLREMAAGVRSRGYPAMWPSSLASDSRSEGEATPQGAWAGSGSPDQLGTGGLAGQGDGCAPLETGRGAGDASPEAESRDDPFSGYSWSDAAGAVTGGGGEQGSEGDEVERLVVAVKEASAHAHLLRGALGTVRQEVRVRVFYGSCPCVRLYLGFFPEPLTS